MATPAHSEANRRNSKRSMGLKSASGKSTARMNSYKHGMTARTIMPVLPQEDARALDERIQQTIAAMQPRTPMESDLVESAVRLSADIDRAERIGTAHLAHRVRKATILDPDRNEAMVPICTTIMKHVGRLEKLLKEYEAIEAEEADERYDRAALDCSRAFERHRRYQSARTRELPRVLEEYRRVSKEEFGEGTADDECQKANDKCQMTDGEAEATDRVVNPGVGQDSTILSHEDTDRTEQATGNGQGVTNDGPAPKKAQNKANLPRRRQVAGRSCARAECRGRRAAGRESNQSDHAGFRVVAD